jgi:hypothetical protein
MGPDIEGEASCEDCQRVNTGRNRGSVTTLLVTAVMLSGAHGPNRTEQLNKTTRNREQQRTTNNEQRENRNNNKKAAVLFPIDRFSLLDQLSICWFAI